MQAYFGCGAMGILIIMLLIRVVLLKRRGIAAVTVGKTHRSDLLLPPFMLLFFYLIAANAFSLPLPFPNSLCAVLTTNSGVMWIGVASCLVGLVGFLLCLISFGQSFRVGIDTQTPGKLVTGGVFSFSRNPLYLSFGFLFLGQTLIFPCVLLLLLLLGAGAVIHRQVLREEAFLSRQYGEEYEAYCKKVRRY